VVATAALQPYRAVKIVSGGINYASSDNPSDLNATLGILGSGVASGAQGWVTTHGPVTNPISGSGGWAWTLGTPIYLGPTGTLVQTPPAPEDGFTRPVGFPLSANTMYVFPPADHLLFNPSALVVSGSTATAYANNSEWVSGAIATNVTLVISGSFVEGQRLDVAIRATSADRTVTLPSGTFVLPAALGTSPITVDNGTETVFSLRWSASLSKWRVLAVAEGY
jgi:hypothetical protein